LFVKRSSKDQGLQADVIVSESLSDSESSKSSKNSGANSWKKRKAMIKNIMTTVDNGLAKDMKEVMVESLVIT
jgi:hypothetical protein